MVSLLLERKAGFAPGFMASALVLVAIGLLALIAVPIGATDLAGLLPVNESSETATVISTGHIRQVSSETALWGADKPVGRIGYKANIEEVHVQQLNGTITWLCPLDFSDPYKALVYGEEGTGGYVLVPAEDPFAEARFVPADLCYAPNAVFRARPPPLDLLRVPRRGDPGARLPGRFRPGVGRAADLTVGPRGHRRPPDGGRGRRRHLESGPGILDG